MKNLLRHSLIVPMVVAVVSVMGTQAQADLIVNGDFQSGNFAGWSLTGTATTGVGGNSGVEDLLSNGNYVAYFSTPATGGGISQAIATTIGEQYSLHFDYSNSTGAAGYFMSYGVDSSPLTTIPGDNPIPSGSADYSFTATSALTNVLFSFQQGTGFWTLDNVSVTDSGSGISAVPEPTSMALMGLGIVGIAFRARRRKTTAPQGAEVL